MDDEYAGFPTKIFIDSNVVLEALPLKDLPWSEIDPAGPILILLTPTLLSEVDSKKRDGRLALRAREFNRLVAPIAQHGQAINLVAGTPRVDIAIARCQRIDWDSYDDLDPTQGDARIIAEVLHANGVPKEQRCVLSQDINPLFMAQRHGLKTHHVSDSWLPQPEPSPQEKEITKLKGQLKDLAKTEPQFEIKLEVHPDPVEIHLVEKLTEGEMSLMIRNIIATNPKPEQEQNPLFRRMQYDSTLDDRYAKYEFNTIPDFVKNYHKKLELLFDQIPFSLSVENTGKVRADHANIDVQIIGGWFNNKPILAGIAPSAPKIKNHLLPIFPSRHIPKNRVIGRHEVEVSEPNRSEQFSAQCEDFRHGQKWRFSGVVWLDPHHNKEAVIIVKVTAANLHGEICMPFKLDKFVRSSLASDLADISSVQIVKNYYIKPLVEAAIKENKYNSFEWDRVTDED